MNNKAKHMKWCKQRAQEHIDRCDFQSAITSFLSDIRKDDCFDEKFIQSANFVGMTTLTCGLTKERAQNFLDGFSDYEGDN